MPRLKNLALYVDYENLRQTLEKTFKTRADPKKIGEVLCKTAKENGNLVVRKVFGDWNFLHHSPTGGERRIDARKAFAAAGLLPVDVPVKGFGVEAKDRTDIFLSVEASFDFFTKKNIGVVMLASSDADYCPLVRHIQEQGKEVIVCSFSASMSPDLAALTPVIPLEKLLGVELPTATIISTEPEPIGPSTRTVATYNWTIFIEALHKAEQQHWKFVGLTHFRDRWMNISMGVNEVNEKSNMINQAIDEQIIFTRKVIREGNAFATTAIKLNKDHPLVAKFLRKS